VAAEEEAAGEARAQDGQRGAEALAVARGTLR
jgi:hypothetical protein